MQEHKLSLPYGTAIVHQKHIVHCNHDFAHILGYGSSDHLLAELSTLIELFSNDYLETIENEIELTLLGYSLPNAYLCKIRSKDGLYIPIAIMLKKMLWNDLSTIEMNVIDTRLAYLNYKGTREQDQMFRDMIINSTQGIIVHREFKPLFVNESWVSMQGANSTAQVLAMDSILSLVREEVASTVRKQYIDLVEHKCAATNTVVENIGLDGVSRYFNIYDNVILWQGEKAVQVILEDVSEKVALENELKFQATHDDLTGLYNRRAVYQWLEEQSNNNAPLVCLLMDIDNFKTINDNHGHQVGDNVICALASTANSVVQKSEGIVGRWGGEEFIAFIPVKLGLKCKLVAEKIRADFEALTFESKQQKSFHSTVSIGVANTNQIGDSASVDLLIQRTDQFLYLAKAEGKNRVCVDCSACRLPCVIDTY
ncbi:sensor domain-containing diguanylate cyclase [Vibrio maerlii]|uniref:sensor domain-containing diguanylate cyclase n=1 Tax=Vibrio maerlii TaxID=2231648 RepID=UPI000E3BA1B9|nr:GGDEF domain-containing protein [Vibrio maerlii]